MNKFKGKLSKEELKRFAKEINKKIVASDFKRGRVANPEKVDEERIREVKKYVKSFFDKAVQKKREREEKMREKEKSKAANISSSTTDLPTLNGTTSAFQLSPAEDLQMPDDDDNDVSSPLVVPPSPSMSAEPADLLDLKRKRENDELSSPADSETKRLKEENTPGPEEGFPPPPPPPPPAGTVPVDLEMQNQLAVQSEETQDEKELREQEEALMRENEEAMAMALDGSLKVEEQEVKLLKASIINEVDNATHTNDSYGSMEGIEEADLKQERKGVLSH